MNNYFQLLVEKTDGNVFVIAEACDNHMGSLDMAKALANSAKFTGADAVKFQHHLAYEEMLKIGEMSANFDEHLYDFLERNSLTLSDHFELKRYCDDIGILYLCTPFSFKAAQEINDLVPFFKIGSGEFSDFWFIDKLAKLNKPVIFSSGMSTKKEIIRNVSHFKKNGLDFALLNCLSEYPPKLEDLNLKFINELINMFPDIVIGHSDHTQTIFSSLLATGFGAKIIEKHITLSEFVDGPDKLVSLNHNDFKKLVSDCKNINICLGENKKIHEDEVKVRKWAYRSIVSTRDIMKGDTITLDDIQSKRPSGGIPSEEYLTIIGKVASEDILKNTQINHSQLNN